MNLAVSGHPLSLGVLTRTLFAFSSLHGFVRTVALLCMAVFFLTLSMAAHAVPVWQTGTGNQTSNSGTTGNTQTVSKPANIQAGDLIIVTLHYERTNLTISNTQGFSLIRRETYTTSTTDGTASRATVAAFYKIATGSEPVTYTFTSSGNSNTTANWRIMANRVTGHHPTQTIGSNNGNNSGTSTTGTSRAITGITTTSNDTLLVSAMSMASGNISNLNVPAGMTLAFSNTTRTAAGVAYQTIATAGATGDRSWSWTTGRNNAGLLFAINPAPAVDYGDAPASYGSASHAIVASIKLGTTAPDAETASQSNFNATGDGADEDGAPPTSADGKTLFPNFPVLKMTDTTYNSTFKVTNTSGTAGKLYGWIDFDKSGTFEADEGTVVNVPTGSSNVTVTLAWNSIPVDIQLGTTFIRVRLTTDAAVTTSTPTGLASNGEVEDYPLAIYQHIPPDNSSLSIINGVNPLVCQAKVFEDNFNDVASDYWGANRVGSQTIRNWTRGGGGAETYASTGNQGAPQQMAVYFGNGAMRGISPSIPNGFTFDANGKLTSTLTAIALRDTPDDLGTDSDSSRWGPTPVTLARSFATTIGKTYRIYFKAIPETDASNTYSPGIMRVDVTSSSTQSIHIKAPGSNDGIQNYAIEFTASAATSTVTFVNYGHVDSDWCNPQTEYWCTVGGTTDGSNPNELILDDVVVAESDCPVVSSTDYGDAPDASSGTATGNYQTLATDNGPRHIIIPNLMIGAQVDADNGTLQNSTATSDDTNASPDDEDGLINPPIMPTTAGQTYSLPVYVKNESGSTAYLTAYIDFNRDGDFVDAGEQADTQFVYWNGYFYPTFTLPSGLTAGTLYARLRLSQTRSEADVPTGAATSGEVEDHTLTVSSGTLYDFGDAPASYGNARHTLNNNVYLGVTRPDAEAASQSSYNARFGDGADEDGAPRQSQNASIPLFPILKMTASSYSTNIIVNNTIGSGAAANLFGWIDFDQNGVFDTDETASVSVPEGTSTTTVALTWNSIPTDIKLGTTFIRLRLTTDAAVTTSTPSNNASNGEVEDYPIAVAIDVPPDSADVTIVKGETPACSSTIFTDNFDDVPTEQYFGANTSATPYVIRNWTATGGGGDAYAKTLTTPLFPAQGTSIYFGNGVIRRFYPDVGIAPQFDGNGRMLSPPDAIELRDNVDDTTPGVNSSGQADWGPEPVKLSRTFATTAGQRYRLYFSAIPEDAGNDYYASGLMRVDTPSGSVHFKAPGGMEGIQKYRIEFTATGASSTISFINYGHLGTDGGYCDPNSVSTGPWCSVGGISINKIGNELIIDDVTVALASACPSSAIAGTVYTDKNGNNAFDSATESGLGNISVSLYDNNGTTATTTDDLKVATVVTAANGSYSFANISAVPRYRIEVDTRDTDLPTSAVIGTTNPLADVVVTAGNTLANQNFGFDLGCNASAGEFGGIVFRDYNQNGIRESQEEGIAGVTVTAYDTANTAVATTTTDARGWYRFSGQTNGAQYRLEFTGLPASLSSGAQGADSATNVRFVTASNSCSTHYGVSDPVEYCQATPYVAANVFVGGDPTAADVGAYTSIHTFPYNATGPAYAETPSASSKASIAQTGAIWGMAYQKSSKTLYASAVMRRFSGLGSLGTGGIYKINMNDPPANTGASTYLDVKTIGIDTGADVRLTDACSPKLASNPWVAAHDVAAWDAVGKVGIGDIDHDDANNRLWLVNLNDRKLYGINNISPTTTPTAANVLGGYSINLPSPYSCTSGTFRPWAVKYHRGHVYVGGVCDASSAPYTLGNLRGYVLRFDPANTAAGFSHVKDFPIDQQRNLYSHNYPAQWSGWIPQADAVGWPYFHSPIVSNLEFDTDGSIIIGVTDRAGMQNGSGSFDEPTCADTGGDYTSSTGDVLRLCKTDSGYAADSEPGCTTDIPNNSKTINEYYWGDMGPYSNSWEVMNEISSGGLAMAPGSANVLMSSYDANTWGTNGIAWLNNRTGGADNRYYVSGTTMGKATGMGELEILCDQSPNEIGNRVWLDTDKDGIQDAGETGINNVNVTLTCGADSASTTTNASGEYYFSNVSGGNASFMGSGENCSLSIGSSQASLSGHTLTTQNADSKTDNNYQTDIRDSDAAVSGSNAVISFTVGNAGQNNHSLDFGYQTSTGMGSISGTVYRDSNQNNSFDSGSENGIASISVSLHDENFTASNTADDTLLSTVSSGADGSYSFSNLNPARSYRIQADNADSNLPAGASIGTANPLTGISVTAGATTGNQNFGFDLASAGSCAAPAPSGTNAYINTAVGWTHDENDPAGQAANHALPAINKPDEIASASNQTAAGLTTGLTDWGLYATTASVPVTLTDAINGNKYLQYSFTTKASLSNTHILYGVGMVTLGTTIGSNHSGKYKIQVQVDDNAAFSSPQVVKTLIQIDETNPTTGASISEGPYDYGVAYYYNHYDFDSPVELASNTTYYVRFYLYDDTVSGFFGGSTNRVVFDNLKLKTHECATSTSNDFGDAPATYGDASHTIVAGIHLGDNAPDGETASKYSFNARNDNHDDGAPSQNAPGAYIPLFPVLQLTDTSYSSSFKVTNSTGTAGKLYGWIDFDKSGTFEEDEATSVDVPTGSGNANVTLNWASIPFDIQLGTTAIRLRLTTDGSVTTSTPTGAASNGEVEDYPIAIAMDIPPNSPSLAIISGATPAACETVVFQDNFDDLTPTVFWGSNRPGSQAIRDWTRSGGGNDSYAHITTPVGQGSSVYFGNGGVRQISPATPTGYTFDANGKLLTTIDAIALRDDMDDFITPGTTANEYGSKADWGPEPVRLARTFATTPGKTYRLYFKAIPENPAGTYASGIMRLDMPGGSIHFKAPGSAEGTQTYAVEFTAFDYNATITFVNYGHTEGSNSGYCDPNTVFNANPWCTVGGRDDAKVGNELIIDDVVLTEAACATGTIRGTVYHDANLNNSHDAGIETGITAVNVKLYDENGTTGNTADDRLVYTASTYVQGGYYFTDVDTSNTYRIEVDTADPDLPAHMVLGTTNPLTGITVTANTTLSNQDFGFDLLTRSNIAGTVYLDNNTNDVFDAGVDYGLGSIKVSLYNDNGTAGNSADDTLLGNTSTAINGAYRFDDLDHTLTYRVAVDTSDTDIPAGAVIGTTNPFTGVAVPANSTVTKNFGFDQASNGITGKVFLDYNLNGQLDSNSAMSNFASNTSIRLAFDKGIAGAQIRAECVGASGKLNFGPVTSDVNGQYYLATPGAVAGNYNCVLQMSSIPAGYSVATQSGSGNQVLTQVVSPTAVNTYFALQEETSYCQNNPEMATNRFAYGQQTPNPPFAGNNDVHNIFAFPYNSGTAGLPNTAPPGYDQPLETDAAFRKLAQANQVGSVFGLGWHPASDSLFASAYMKAWTGFGSGGTGGIYRVDMSNPASPTTSLYANLNQIFPANPPTAGADPYLTGVFSAGNPGYVQIADGSGSDPDGSYVASGNATRDNQDGQITDAVGKTAFGDLDVSADGKSLFAVNMANHKLYILPVRAAPLTAADAALISSYSIPFASNCKVGGTRRAFGLGEYQGGLYIATECGADYGLPWEVPEHSVFRFDLTSKTFSTTPSLVYSRPSEDTYGIDFSTITDIVFDPAGNMTLTFREILPSPYGPSVDSGKGTGYSVIRRACVQDKATFTWTKENNGSCGGVTTAGKDTGYGSGPGYGKFFHQEYPADHGPSLPSASYGGAAQIPGFMEAAYTIAEPFEFYSVGVSWVDTGLGNPATAGQRNRAFSFYKGTGAFEYADNRPVNGKNAAIGDLEILCDTPSLEIGNRVWQDSDSDGVQDAGEAPVAGVKVELFANGANLASATPLATVLTDANGYYVFSSDMRGYPATGNNAPNDTTGANGGFNAADIQGGRASTASHKYGLLSLTPNTQYQVVIRNVGGASKQAALGSMTLSTAAQGTDAELDSDAGAVGDHAVANVSMLGYGNHYHAVDFGFKAPIVSCDGRSYGIYYDSANNYSAIYEMTDVGTSNGSLSTTLLKNDAFPFSSISLTKSLDNKLYSVHNKLLSSGQTVPLYVYDPSTPSIQATTTGLALPYPGKNLWWISGGLDPAGNLYFMLKDGSYLVKINLTTSQVTTVWSSWPATTTKAPGGENFGQLSVNVPSNYTLYYDITFDSNGDALITDADGHYVWKVTNINSSPTAAYVGSLNGMTSISDPQWINDGGTIRLFGSDANTPDGTHYIDTTTWNTTKIGTTSFYDMASCDFSILTPPASNNSISGKVFEDVNYGGGAGRPLSTAGAAGVLGVRVELYNSTGNFLTSTTTTNGGPYSFGSLANGTYYVRVVNDTIRSTRAGSDASERSIQTFRSDGTTAVTNEVGGRKPALVDAAANTTSQTLNTGTFVLSGGGQAQSVQPVTVSGSNITGADFGFNFSTVININNSGQGSLRQAILNANLLANSMTQPGSNYGVNTALNKEVLVFNIPASGDPQGRADICSGTTCNITVNSKLPDITAPLIIDGATQPGYTAGTPGVPRIRIAPAAGLDAIGISIAYTATDSTVRGLSITGFRTSSMNRAINVAAARTVVESNYLGVKPDGTADANGQGIMLEYADTATTVIGGTTAAKRNIISGNLNWGIAYDTGATAGTIQNNFIGTNVAGTAALGNQFGGVDLESANDTFILDNVIAGNAGDGLQIGYTNGTILTSGYTIRGNRIGVGINSEAIGNTGPGIMNYGGSSNHQIGGTAAGQANIIANNMGGGIKLAANSAGVNNIISGNSFYANGNLGIDLGNNGVTVNDANDADTGANDLLNFPLIADLSVASGNLTVKGCAPGGATVELFEADVSAGGKATPGDNKVGKSKDYGEGQSYLASFVEGGASDTDAANCALTTDTDGNNQTGMKAFRFSITVPATVANGDYLTATATISGVGTSEFSPATKYTVQQTFSCDANIYMIHAADTSAPSQLTRVDTTSRPFTLVNIGDTSHGYSLNALGYRVQDNYLYAIKRGTNSLLRIGSAGSVVELGSIAGLPVPGSSQFYDAGDIFPDGYLYVRDSGNGPDIYKIDVTTSPPSLVQALALSQSISVADFAYNKADGKVYSVGKDGTKYMIDPASWAINIIGSNASPSVYGSMYTDNLGNTYAYKNSPGTFYQVDFGMNGSGSGTMTTLGAGPDVSHSDGASCRDAPPITGGNTVAGRVYEDVNYGGGAGRPFGTAGAVGVSNATVELYDATGTFLYEITTSVDGSYNLQALPDGAYYVRVVNSTIKSSRSGSDGSEIAAQTYRSNGAGAVSNEIGGRKPSVADAEANTSGQTLNTTTFVLSGGGQAQSVQEITLSGSSINNVDFGFNFSSVVNTNDNGQGSLRQFLLNANLLGDDTALAQEGRSTGKEHAILILPTSDPHYAGGVWTILLNSTTLPNIDKPLILDGSTQTGFNPATGVPVIKLDGNNLAGNGLSLVAGSTGSSIRSLAITRFGGDGINLQSNTTGNSILGNSIHTNGGLGIDLVGGTENAHGVTANASNDTGPNNLLNYPEFKTLGITDSTKIITYDFDLDVPVGTYRLEFFKNDSTDASGHGEGQIYLGGRDIEVSATGKQNYKGSFNANQLLAGNDKVSATLTRKVGADFTDTSEFAGTATGSTTTVCQDWITNPTLAPADFNIAENSSVVAFITAKDASGNAITYALKGADGKYFAITASSPTTPECKTIKMIDPNVIITKAASVNGEAEVRAVPAGYLPPPGNFESPADADKNNVYEVQVVATYADGSQMTRELKVRVLNENEAPVIVSAPAVSLVEDTTTTVLDIASQDQDAGTSEGNGLSYRISGGADASFLAVSSSAGILTFRAIPDYDAPVDSNRDNIYEVEVTVTDSTGLSNSKLFTVTVTNNTADDGILLQARAFLQGAYDGGSQMMADDLNVQGLLPAKQPYDSAPFNYAGTETLSDMLRETTGNNAPVDWMLVELRSSVSKVVASRAVIVQRDGDLVDAQTGSPDLHFARVAAGNYHVAIRHRNHLDVITTTPVSLLNTARMVDFTLSATAVRTEQSRVMAGKLALMWAGDINGSHTLTASGPGNDATTLLSSIITAADNPQAYTNYVMRGYLPTDLNLDGKTLFTGPNNDASLLVGNILLHPLNTEFAGNYIVRGSLSQ